jgi:hypothetical protein
VAGLARAFMGGNRRGGGQRPAFAWLRRDNSRVRQATAARTQRTCRAVATRRRRLIHHDHLESCAFLCANASLRRSSRDRSLLNFSLSLQPLAFGLELGAIQICVDTLTGVGMFPHSGSRIRRGEGWLLPQETSNGQR